MKSPLHPYIVFEMEITAVKKWLQVLNQNEETKTGDRLLKEFLPEFYSLGYWTFYRQLEMPRPTKEEKILFLYYHMSLGMNKVRDITQSGNSHTIDTIKNPRNKRHLTENIGIDTLIKEWQKYRNKIPDEIFIKYL